MSNFPQPPHAGYYDPNMPVEPARKSGLAVTSLVLALIGIIPCLGLLTAPIGVLLGLIGLVAIKPPKTGKGMCAVAVVLGILFTGAQVVIGKKYVIDPIRGFITFAMNGPSDAMTAGFNGDIAGFKASFDGAGATASDAEAKAFIDELRDRYGAFQSATLPQGQQNTVMQPQPGQTALPFPYEFRFANATVSGEAELIFADSAGALTKKLGYIKITDPDKGDIQYPPTIGGGAANTPTGGGSDAGAPDSPPSDPPATSPNG